MTLQTSAGGAVLSTIDVARRADRAEIEFCALAGSAPLAGDRAEVLEAGGGHAVFSRPGSPLNKVLGLGLSGPVPDADLDRIEAFYRTRRVPVQIELCPLAHADLPARLCARGFVVEAFENELGAWIDAVPVSQPAGVKVTQTSPEQDDLWTQIVAAGFAAGETHVGGAPDAPPAGIDAMIGMMSQFRHPAIRRYLAWIDGEPAGGGAAWVYSGVVGIFGTATVERFRRRGVQAAVAMRTVEDARGSADLAIATTAPGSTSQRTFARLGFQVLYTRAVFVKPY